MAREAIGGCWVERLSHRHTAYRPVSIRATVEVGEDDHHDPRRPPNSHASDPSSFTPAATPVAHFGRTS
jgi:hypothetical protein